MISLFLISEKSGSSNNIRYTYILIIPLMNHSMRADIHPIHILCFGYSSQYVEKIEAGLKPYGSFVCTAADNWVDRPFDTVDLFLFGQSDSYDHLSSQLVSVRDSHPQIPLIYCSIDGNILPFDDPLTTFLDGYFILEEKSEHWGLNLSSLINNAVKCQKIVSGVTSRDSFYKEIFEKNPISMSLTIPESGMFVEVNKAFLQAYGYTQEEVIGHRSFDLTIFGSKEERDSVIKACTREHPARDFELKVRTKENKTITALFSADVLYRDGQELFLLTMKDISKQKQIEEEIKDTNLFISNILSNITEGIIVYDISLGHRVWNRYMEELTGIPASDILGKPSDVFNPELEGDDTPFLIREALQGITSISKDLHYHIPSTGKSGWVSVIYTPYVDASNTITGVIVSVRDINERKRYENELISHELHLRSIIDTVPVWISCLDRDKRFTLANISMCSAFNITPSLVEGKSFEQINADSKELAHYDAMLDRALQGREVPFDKEMIDPTSKNTKYLRGRFSPLKDVSGNIEGVVSVVIDITDLILAQQTIESINSKLHLLSSITRHDILNSLTAVLGYLAIAIEEKDPDERNSYLFKAYQTALLIQEQAEFSRDYQDIGVNKPVWHNAKDVFRNAIKSLKLGDISVEVSLDDLMVYADPLLERVIYNLVDNTLRYGKNVTRISSYWRKEADYIVWVLEDNGVGVVSGMKDHIFKKGVGHNTGLGLFLTREILDITGLSIRETGMEGEGARFEIGIPNELWKLQS